VVCSPTSLLVAVMVQELAHHVNYLWVVDKDANYCLAGIVSILRCAEGVLGADSVSCLNDSRVLQ
jgi:hypothetical protein